ncbi:MAG: hypothetical protein EOP09_19140 [Proteobacteria bacterium]|nr:MAG: hypothetical protein EOP09_19140 [Pseudomonadota bacterium]
MNKQFISEYSLYVASKLGQAHGRQSTGPAFLAAIKANPDAFRESIKLITKAYISEALSTLGN